MFLLFGFKAQATNVVSDLRVWSAPEYTQVVLAMSEKSHYQLQYSAGKSQLIILLPDADVDFLLDRKLKNDKRIVSIRTKKEKGKLLLAIDLKATVRVKSFLALPNEQYGHRLMVDLQDVVEEEVPIKSTRTDNKLLIAIDAGHGGEDSGAIGVNRLKEKNVVLAIARNLSNSINNSPNMRAMMIREGDYYLSLKNRVKKAEKLKADIFISIHADAYINDSAKGASVYIVSKEGASSRMAKWLANKENSADLIGGISVEESTDNILDQVLADLTSSANFKDSKLAAKQVLQGFRDSPLMDIHSLRVEQSNFFVLKQNKIPAILIETGFMSNPDESIKLEDSNYQKQVAQLIFNALVKFRKSQ